jgi:predicted transcriptional regulator
MGRSLPDVIPIRLDKDLQANLKRLADKNGRTRSDEMRQGLKYWTRLLERPEMHIGALTCLIAILVRRIEARTGKTWLNDPATGVAVHEEVGRLIECFIPEAKEPPVISPELRQITYDLIVIFGHLCREPQLAPVHAGDDWGALAVIAKDLGPALLRKANKAVVTITEIKGRQK